MNIPDRDPALVALSHYLFTLSCRWFEDRNERTLQNYHAAFRRFEELGGSIDQLDVEAQLPPEYMPKDKPRAEAETASD